MDKSWPAVTVLALGLAACRGAMPSPSDAATAQQDRAKEAAMQEWTGQFSGMLQNAQRVVASVAQWQALWSEIGQSAPPSPDFGSSVAVAVFLGQRSTGGYRIQWLQPDSSGTVTVVRYKEMKPQGITMQVLTQPYAVKVFPRSRSPITVEAARE
jgi:hypothetical protein